MPDIEASAWSIAGAMGAVTGTEWTEYVQCGMLQPLRELLQDPLGLSHALDRLHMFRMCYAGAIWTVTISVHAIATPTYTATASLWDEEALYGMLKPPSGLE